MKRNTAQRSAIKATFIQYPRPLTVKEVLKYSRMEVNTLNQSTVYRNLKVLLTEGWLICLTHPTLGQLYERAGKAHHHHFYCRQCRCVFELEGCALKKQPSVPRGFIVEDHEIFLHGVCAACT